MLEIGSLVDGKYKILNSVGKGGMSRVYLAMNEKANKQWAVKEVLKDGVKDLEVVKQALVTEIEILKKLSHPNLPSIVDVIESEDAFIIIMDYIQGNSLLDKLIESGAQPQEDVVEWAKQLCDVLLYLHTRKPPIIYRDMKPGNVMLKPDGTITLIDFGTAREFNEKKVLDTTKLGTLGYAAPEQHNDTAQTDARTDIYSLGVTMHHLVTNKEPGSLKTIREINPLLSKGLEEIIIKCMQQDPDKRYQSAAELKYALEHWYVSDGEEEAENKKKLRTFLVPTLIALLSTMTSVFGYVSAENKKSENYAEILKIAESTEDYYEAVLTDPTQVDAYLQLNDFLAEDRVLSKNEGTQLLKFHTGLDRKNNKGFSERVDVLKRLKDANPEGYQDVCYKIGDSFLFYYDTNVDRDRYASAAKWFEDAKEKYPIAGIYCDIYKCLELIDQYNGSKIKQTEKMYEEYGNLWMMIGELRTKANEFEDGDSKIQVWNEINKMINSNIVPFLEVTSQDEITVLLQAVYEDAGEVTKSIMQEDIKELQQAIKETMKKVASVKK